ncbi:hypothetical protein BDR05DRAFT_967293 [Suillus weaverae]|nr:hypothetical protein BDR05DRAFT_967293 [Suillus weaverae]
MDSINIISQLESCDAGRPPSQLTSSPGQISDRGRLALRAFAHYLASSCTSPRSSVPNIFALQMFPS